MRITIQVVCDDAVEAQKVIGKLAAENTWVDQIEQVKTDTKARDARLDKIMGSSGAAAEQSGSDDGATGAPRPDPHDTEDRNPNRNGIRPNISPGEPSIGKIGADAKQAVYNLVTDGEPIPKKYAEHCKLLWKRGEIKFDGTEYYL